MFIFEDNRKRNHNYSTNNINDSILEYNTLNYLFNLIVYLDYNNHSSETIKTVIDMFDYKEKVKISI